MKTSNKTAPVRCGHCGGGLGLRSHKRHGKRFCSDRCTGLYEVEFHQPSLVPFFQRCSLALRRIFGARTATQER